MSKYPLFRDFESLAALYFEETARRVYSGAQTIGLLRFQLLRASEYCKIVFSYSTRITIALRRMSLAICILMEGGSSRRLRVAPRVVVH